MISSGNTLINDDKKNQRKLYFYCNFFITLTISNSINQICKVYLKYFKISNIYWMNNKDDILYVIEWLIDKKV